MRVLFLVPGLDTPGQHLVSGLAAREDVSVELLCSNPESYRSLQNDVLCQPFSTRGKLDPWAISALRQRMKSGGYDIVQCFSSRMLSNALLATSGLANSPKLLGFMGFMGRFSRWNPAHYLTYLHPRVAGVCCNCDAAARPLAAAGVAPEKLFTIYFGQPSRPLEPLPNFEIRRELGIPEQATVVAFAGNMRPVKRVDLLLQAAQKLSNDENLHWLLLGRVQDSRIGRLADDPVIRDQVHLLGWRDDADRLLRAADMFLMPSRSEGFSRAIFEAMEIGLCPIATRVGGTPELIRDGVDGLLVRSERPDEIADAIRRLTADPVLRKTLADSARQRIEHTFTVEKMVESTIDMFHTVLQHRPAAASLKAA